SRRLQCTQSAALPHASCVIPHPSCSLPPALATPPPQTPRPPLAPNRTLRYGVPAASRGRAGDGNHDQEQRRSVHTAPAGGADGGARVVGRRRRPLDDDGGGAARPLLQGNAL